MVRSVLETNKGSTGSMEKSSVLGKNARFVEVVSTSAVH